MEKQHNSNLVNKFENKWNDYLFENMMSLCNLPEKLEDICKRWSVFWIRPNITLQYINDHLEHPWNWKNISQNAKINEYDIKNYNHFPWDYNEMLFINDKLITLQIIEDNMDYMWNYEILSYNEIITLEYIKNNIDKNWNWGFISLLNAITLDFIEEFIDNDFNWYNLSHNKNITTEFVKKYSNKKWNWKKLVINNIVSLQFVIDCYKNNIGHIVNISYFIQDISENYSNELLFDFIKNNIDFPFDWNFLAPYSNILTLDFIEEHDDFDWDFVLLGKSELFSLKTFQVC